MKTKDCFSTGAAIEPGAVCPDPAVVAPSRRRLMAWAAASLLGVATGRAVATSASVSVAAAASASSSAGPVPAAALPLFDAHLHYSHDAWSLVPPAQAVALLRAAGLRTAMVSSADDEGTQMLRAAAPDLVVPVLRPYRRRDDVGTWVRDPQAAAYLAQRLERHRYAGIGEFHLFGDEVDLPVPRRMVALARERGLLLHAHSDIAAVEGLFRQWPQARILWAHAGFETPQRVREVLRRHPALWCDLAFRSDPGSGGAVDPAWREAFEEFPERFMVGTDTFTPERWHYVGPHAQWARGWLASLPQPLAERIAWRNGQAMLEGVWTP